MTKKKRRNKKSNPNKCLTCDHKNHGVNVVKEHGWCYMCKDAPTAVCYQHTLRQEKNVFMGLF